MNNILFKPYITIGDNLSNQQIKIFVLTFSLSKSNDSKNQQFCNSAPENTAKSHP